MHSTERPRAENRLALLEVLFFGMTVGGGAVVSCLLSLFDDCDCGGWFKCWDGCCCFAAIMPFVTPMLLCVERSDDVDEPELLSAVDRRTTLIIFEHGR